jgi:hypothetical protein
MSKYSRGNNWSSSKGSYSNGRGHSITSPKSYFSAVGSNSKEYNSSYANGDGTSISRPSAYFDAVGSDRYGYNGTKK